MTEKQIIDAMVDRFLGWRLPADFSPDAGISFNPTFNENTPWPMKHEPTGTNLLDAEQAKAMFEYCLQGATFLAPTPKESLPVAAQDGEAVAASEDMKKALHRAFELGKTWWQQADSESYRENARADETKAKFDALVAEAAAPFYPASTVEALRAERDESDAVTEKLSRILAEVAIALKGPELPLHRHSYHHLGEVAQTMKLELDISRHELAALQQRIVDLEARPVAVVPDTHVMAPVAPTPKMAVAAWEWIEAAGKKGMGYNTAAGLIWTDMLSAAPVTPLRTITPERLSELEANERRYLFLRNESLALDYQPFIAIHGGTGFSRWTSDAADERIDAAIDALAAQEKAG